MSKRDHGKDGKVDPKVEAIKRAMGGMVPDTKLLMPDSFPRLCFDFVLLAVIVLFFGIATFHALVDYDAPVLMMMLGIDVLVQLLFFIHVILRFTTVQWYDTENRLITSFGEVAKATLREPSIYLDIIACLPVSTIGHFAMGVSPAVWSRLRLVNCIKIYAVYNDLSACVWKSSNPMLMSNGYVNFFFSFRGGLLWLARSIPVVHICALIKVAISQQHLTEVRALEQGLDWDGATFYGLSLFWVMNVVGSSVADHSLHNSAEFVYTAALFVASILFQGLIIGNLSDAVAKDSVTNILGPTMRHTSELLDHYKIPANVSHEILGYQSYMLTAGGHNALSYKVTGRLPKTMLTEISLYTKANLLRKVPLLSQTSDRCRFLLAKKMHTEAIKPTTVVIEAMDKTKALYFVQHGLLDVVANGQTMKDKTLRRGDSFGQDALATGSPSPYTIRALTFCALLRLSAKDFKSMAQKTDELSHLLQGRCKDAATPKERKVKAAGDTTTADPPAESTRLPADGNLRTNATGPKRRMSLAANLAQGSKGAAPRGAMVDDALSSMAVSKEPLNIIMSNMTTLADALHGRLHGIDERLKALEEAHGGGDLFGEDDSHDDDDDDDDENGGDAV